MSKFDDMIQSELQKEAAEIDELLAVEGGLPDMVAAAWKGSMRRWVWATTVITLAVTAVMIWCGYMFFTRPSGPDQSFWGICTVLAMAGQVALKQWQWLEMNRASLMREIKRLELAVAALARRQNKV